MSTLLDTSHVEAGPRMTRLNAFACYDLVHVDSLSLKHDTLLKQEGRFKHRCKMREKLQENGMLSFYTIVSFISSSLSDRIV